MRFWLWITAWLVLAGAAQAANPALEKVLQQELETYLSENPLAPGVSAHVVCPDLDRITLAHTLSHTAGFADHTSISGTAMSRAGTPVSISTAVEVSAPMPWRSPGSCALCSREISCPPTSWRR